MPFLACLIVLLTAGDLSVRQVAAQTMQHYAAVIAAFLGAVHWGIAAATDDGTRPARLRWGVTPALVSWALLALLTALGATELSRRTGRRRLAGAALTVAAVLAVWPWGLGDRMSRLRAAGLHSLSGEAEHYGLGVVLGNGEVTLRELVGAYAVLARGGVRFRDSVANCGWTLPQHTTLLTGLYVLLPLLLLWVGIREIGGLLAFHGIDQHLVK